MAASRNYEIVTTLMMFSIESLSLYADRVVKNKLPLLTRRSNHMKMSHDIAHTRGQTYEAAS